VHQLFIEIKKAYDSVRRETLYNILIEFGIPKKLVRLVKMCLTETYGRVRVDKYLPEMFPIRDGLKQGDALIAIAVQLCLIVCHQEGRGKPGWLEIKWYTSVSGLCQ
jgi:hypothetical protein